MFPSVYELGFPLVCWSESQLEYGSEYESGSPLVSQLEFLSAFALGSRSAYASGSQSVFPSVYESAFPLGY